MNEMGSRSLPDSPSRRRSQEEQHNHKLGSGTSHSAPVSRAPSEIFNLSIQPPATALSIVMSNDRLLRDSTSHFMSTSRGLEK